MCLFPIKMKNKKYTATEKNGGCVPNYPIISVGNYEEYVSRTENGWVRDYKKETSVDDRVSEIEIPCGNCIECRKKIANGWRIRLLEEIKTHKYMYFVTLTFSPEELSKLVQFAEKPESNYIASIAVRRMLERYRKKYKVSMKHWLITELGHQGTERIHLHGIVFPTTEQEFELLERQKNGWMAKWKWWKYGNIFVGDYVNAKTVNYIVKYVTKIDTDHQGFKGQVLCSPGIGKNFIENSGILYTYKYIKNNSRTDYRTPEGGKMALPTYYKNHLYDDNERELIWREQMDKKIRVIAGNEYDGDKDTTNVLEKAREQNKFYGYGDNSQEWRKMPYNITKKMLQVNVQKAAIAKMAAAIAEARNQEAGQNLAREIIENSKKRKKNLVN